MLFKNSFQNIQPFLYTLPHNSLMIALSDLSLSRQSWSGPDPNIVHVLLSQQFMDDQEERIVMDILYFEGPQLCEGILVMN